MISIRSVLMHSFVAHDGKSAMIRKLTLIFGACGFLLAFLLGIAWEYLIGHTSINPHSAPLLSDITDWLWPTNPMLMTIHDEGWWSSARGLFLSAIANGLIYAVIGLIVGTIRKLFVGGWWRTSER